jgi:hypothetical protein
MPALALLRGRAVARPVLRVVTQLWTPTIKALLRSRRVIPPVKGSSGPEPWRVQRRDLGRLRRLGRGSRTGSFLLCRPEQVTSRPAPLRGSCPARACDRRLRARGAASRRQVGVGLGSWRRPILAVLPRAPPGDRLEARPAKPRAHLRLSGRRHRTAVVHARRLVARCWVDQW